MVNWYSQIEKYYLVVLAKEEKNDAIKERIALFDPNNKLRGYVSFYDDKHTLPDNTEDVWEGIQWCRINMHQSQYPYIVDLLRNEKPVYLLYYDSIVSIESGREPVGESELPPP